MVAQHLVDSGFADNRPDIFFTCTTRGISDRFVIYQGDFGEDANCQKFLVASLFDDRTMFSRVVLKICVVFVGKMMVVYAPRLRSLAKQYDIPWSNQAYSV